MPVSRPRPQRGDFPPGTQRYGQSHLGAPLLWFPAPLADSRSGLILAGTHGDEGSSIVTLSCALRTLKPELRRHHVVLAVNPDGCQLGLRANARGIDLNRNFPAANWKEGETVYRWNSAAEQRSPAKNPVQNRKPRRCASCSTRSTPRGWSRFTIRWPVLKIPATANWASG